MVCSDHELRFCFGSDHAVAHAACVEHNAIHHPEITARAPKLISVVYESAAAVGFDAADLATLFAESRSRNRAFGITGMLLAENGRFLQALEGPAAVLDQLMSTIARDVRHQHGRILAREEITVRRFPDWAMAHGHIDELESLPLVQYYEGLLTARARTAQQRADLIWVA